MHALPIGVFRPRSSHWLPAGLSKHSYANQIQVKEGIYLKVYIENTVHGSAADIFVHFP